MTGLDILYDLVVFLGCVCLAVPVVYMAYLAYLAWSDWRAWRRPPYRYPTSTASNVDRLPRDRVYDFEGDV